MRSRLHIHGHTEPQGRAFIVADKAALRALAQACTNASKGVLGMEMIKFYSSDGHEYELVITSDVAEEEWQNIPVPYNKGSDPSKLLCVQDLDSIRKELSTNENA